MVPQKSRTIQAKTHKSTGWVGNLPSSVETPGNSKAKVLGSNPVKIRSVAEGDLTNTDLPRLVLVSSRRRRPVEARSAES
ncbi:unnamed protein product [Clavelina lepadiformis]|uniref:Uncharacterized protein n=1 Tax=Clavelina lepadiformis TaxID=159417 RepID=A0ABP0GQ63_CLALP